MNYNSNPIRTATCFATLALGRQYRKLALLLAQDLEIRIPEIRLIVLTDNPREFSNKKNVQSFLHKNKGVNYCYHDKRFAIAKALSLYPNCIFVDADCRVGKSPPDEFWNDLSPGIHGFGMCSLEEKLNSELKAKTNSTSFALNTAKRRYQLTEAVTKRENINIEGTTFFQESVLVVCSDLGKEIEFLRTWDNLANFFQLRGFSWGEGRAIGLAAKKADLKIQKINSIDSWLFKDLFYEAQIRDGRTPPEWAANFSKERKLISEEYRLTFFGKTINFAMRLTISMVNSIRIISNDPVMRSVSNYDR